MRYRIDDLAELALAFFECRRKAVGQRTMIERRERLAAPGARQYHLEIISLNCLEQRPELFKLEERHVAGDGQRVVRLDTGQPTRQSFHRAPALHAVFDERQAIALSDFLQGRRALLHAEEARGKRQSRRLAREALEQSFAAIHQEALIPAHARALPARDDQQGNIRKFHDTSPLSHHHQPITCAHIR